MPVIFDPPLPPPPLPPAPETQAPSIKQPYYVRDPQDWAIEQERMRHNQSLYSYGEYVFFVLMWNITDFKLGFVGRCSRCYNGTIVDSRVSEVYNQPTDEKCPVCFGTTFEGGYRARIVRPTLLTFTEDVDTEGRRGFTESATASMQSTSDFQVHTGDIVIRGDNTRWHIQSLSGTYLTSGMQTGTTTDQVAAFAFGDVVKEDPASVAYLLPPLNTPAQMHTLLSPKHSHYPLDWSDYEDIRGPLLYD